MSPKHREMGLLEKADSLATTQESFTTSQNIKLYGENPEGGSEAICHNAVVEDLDRKSTRLNSSHSQISYAVFCLKKKKIVQTNKITDIKKPHHYTCTVCIHNNQLHSRHPRQILPNIMFHRPLNNHYTSLPFSTHS